MNNDVKNKVLSKQKVSNGIRKRRRKIYKKLTKAEIEERKESEKCDEYSFIKAGNEGKQHMEGKIRIAKQLYAEYENIFDKSNDSDGVWFEYPIVPDYIISNGYQSKKLKYLLSLYQKIQVADSKILKNLHNIFNSNLKSKLRGKKSISSLDIKKIVDIAVIANGNIIHVVEIVSKNKLTKEQKESLETESKTGGFLFEEIIV